jgi:outer membrane murein-binding lipoprotein Lpp
MLTMIKLISLLSLIAISGCASVINDKNQKIQIIASNGQEIKGTVERDTIVSTKVDGKVKKSHVKAAESSFSGTTNAVMLERSNVIKTVVVENPECEKETAIKNSVSPAFFGNILIGGLLGSSTDAGSGKMWQYQEKVVVTCK